MDEEVEVEGSCDTRLMSEENFEKVIGEELKEEDQEQEDIIVIPLKNNNTFTCDECGKSKKT